MYEVFYYFTVSNEGCVQRNVKDIQELCLCVCMLTDKGHGGGRGGLRSV